jgi:CBS domain-containing protein
MPFIIFDGGIFRPFQPIVNEQPPVAPVANIRGIAALAHDAGAHGHHPEDEAISAYTHDRIPDKQRRPARTVAQLMSSPVITVPESASVEAARTLCKTHRFRHVPVCGKDGRLAGILSDRDFLAIPKKDTSMRVSQIMQTRVLVTEPESELREAVRVMISERINALPVTNAQYEVVGILTSWDLLKCIANDEPLDLWI